MPCSAWVVSLAFSDEKQMPFIWGPSRRRSLSLAVTTATVAPAPARRARIVSARRYFGSFIMTSTPACGSQEELPELPCADGGAPVTGAGVVAVGKDDITQAP